MHPNLARTAVAEFETNFNGSFNLVTQNIGGLHQRAGSVLPIHMHGSLLQAKCCLCGQAFGIRTDLDHRETYARCKKAGALMLDIV
jgi:NAD-dependent deacetylase